MAFSNKILLSLKNDTSLLPDHYNISYSMLCFLLQTNRNYYNSDAVAGVWILCYLIYVLYQVKGLLNDGVTV